MVVLKKSKALLSLLLAFCMVFSVCAVAFADEAIEITQASGTVQVSGVSIVAEAPVTMTGGANVNLTGASYLQSTNGFAIDNQAGQVALREAVVFGIKGVASNMSKVSSSISSVLYISPAEVAELLPDTFTPAEKAVAAELMASRLRIALKKPGTSGFAALTASATSENGIITVTGESRTVDSGAFSYTFYPTTATCTGAENLGEEAFTVVNNSYVAYFNTNVEGNYNVVVNYAVKLNLTAAQASAILNLPHNVAARIMNAYDKAVEKQDALDEEIDEALPKIADLYEYFLKIMEENHNTIYQLGDKYIDIDNDGVPDKVSPILLSIQDSVETIGGTTLNAYFDGYTVNKKNQDPIYYAPGTYDLDNVGIITDLLAYFDEIKGIIEEEGMTGLFEWADVNYETFRGRCDDLYAELQNILDCLNSPVISRFLSVYLSEKPDIRTKFDNATETLNETMEKIDNYVKEFDENFTEETLDIVINESEEFVSIADKAAINFTGDFAFAIANTANANVSVVAPSASLTLSVAGLGVINFESAGLYVEPYDVFQQDFNVGEYFCVEAQPVSEESVFVCWKDGNGRIVSTESVYEFALSSNTALEAVFAESDEGDHYVVFVGGGNKVIASGYYPDGTLLSEVIADLNVTEEDTYISDAFSFDSWDHEDDYVIDGDTTVYAKYLVNDFRYTVTVAGGTIANANADNKYVYDSAVTINLDATQIPDGMYFAGWSLDGGETIISYNETYVLLVSGNAAVTAVYAEEETEAVPTVTINNVALNEGKISFVVERSVPEGYTFISSGILFSKVSGYTDKTMVLENSGNGTLIRGTTVSTDANGKYMAIITNASVAYARGYLVYMDGDGYLHTLYTDGITVGYPA